MSPLAEKANSLLAIWLCRRFCSRLQVLPYTENAAMLYGSMRAALECIGQPIGVNGLHITAHARSHGLILVNNNLREFERVPGLMMENWLGDCGFECVAIATVFLYVGSRTDNRGTFLCLSKEKYPKEMTPECRVNPALLRFERGFPKGLPSPYVKRDASLHRPCGQFPSNPPVLGAA